MDIYEAAAVGEEAAAVPDFMGHIRKKIVRVI
jgi:hypothetical protein